MDNSYFVVDDVKDFNIVNVNVKKIDYLESVKDIYSIYCNMDKANYEILFKKYFPSLLVESDGLYYKKWVKLENKIHKNYKNVVISNMYKIEIGTHRIVQNNVYKLIDKLTKYYDNIKNGKDLYAIPNALVKIKQPDGMVFSEDLLSYLPSFSWNLSKSIKENCDNLLVKVNNKMAKQLIYDILTTKPHMIFEIEELFKVCYICR